MKRIPVVVRLPTGNQTIQWVTEAEAEKLVIDRRCRAARNKRGHIKRLVVIERLTGLIHLERDGYCFKQTLENGRVYALVGTTGTED